MKIPLTAASFVYAAGNEQPQKNELKPGYEMLYYIAQQRDWEAAEIVFAYFLAALESDADKQAFTKLYEENHIHMEQAAMRILKDQTVLRMPCRMPLFRLYATLKKFIKFPVINCTFGASL